MGGGQGTANHPARGWPTAERWAPVSAQGTHHPGRDQWPGRWQQWEDSGQDQGCIPGAPLVVAVCTSARFFPSRCGREGGGVSDVSCSQELPFPKSPEQQWQAERKPTLTHQGPSTSLGPPGLSSSCRGPRSGEGGALGRGREGRAGPMVWDMTAVTQGIQQPAHTVPLTEHGCQTCRTASLPSWPVRRLWL